MKLTGDRCRCSSCGEYFNSTRAFDKHRTGAYTPWERRCRSTGEMLARGMSRNRVGCWVTAKFKPWQPGDGDLATIAATPCPGSGSALARDKQETVT